jgi:hypothetical protein
MRDGAWFAHRAFLFSTKKNLEMGKRSGDFCPAQRPGKDGEGNGQ